MKLKLCKILSGVPVLPIVVGGPALIYHHGRVTRTTAVLDVYRQSATEVRFETRHALYILKVNSADVREEVRRYENAGRACD